MQNLARFR